MLVEPSSLIFLVIIGIWAAYFVQYWVRRREHLATIRSVDAFSETMRVLERRAPLPTVDTGSQAPRTYAVSPARVMRPQVTVKRAEAHTLARVETHAAAGRVGAGAPDAGPSRQVPRSAPVADVDVARMHPSRAMRGMVLLVGVAGTVVVGLLAAFGVLVPWAPLVPLAMAVVGFAWLRAGVRSESRARDEARRAQRRAVRPAARVQARPAPATARSSAPEAVAAPAAVAEEHTGARASSPGETVEAVETVEAAPEPGPADVPFDASAVDTSLETDPAAPESREPVTTNATAAHGAAASGESEPVAPVAATLPEVDEDDIPLTWDPRPVPRPTYTMKAKAPGRPLPPAEVEPAAEADEPAYELPERRISGL